jgi:hypothetical protein
MEVWAWLVAKLQETRFDILPNLQVLEPSLKKLDLVPFQILFS